MSDLKATLNDKMIGRLALADKGQYLVRDTDLTGFFLVIGTKKKTFTVQGEFWRDGKRHHKKVAIGSTDDLTTREARTLAKDVLAKIAKGEYAEEAKANEAKAEAAKADAPLSVAIPLFDWRFQP